MLFSIIIPVYNTKCFLKPCFDSMEAQKSDNFEIIIIDDGSTDGSETLCDEFVERFNRREGRLCRARVVHQKNRGLSAARNRGLEEAKGDWIWFVDSDDFIEKDALAAIEERMKFANGDLYAFQYVKTDEAGTEPEYIFFRDSQETILIKNEGSILWYYSDRLFNYSDGWEAFDRIYKREIIERYNLRFRDTKSVFAEDLCFMAEYLMCVKSVVLLVNYLYYYRQRSTSIMRTLDQHTIIPRLIYLLEAVYCEAKVLKKKIICKHFERVSRELLKDHIKLKLDELSDEEICDELLKGTQNKVVGKSIKLVIDDLMQAAKGERERKKA